MCSAASERDAARARAGVSAAPVHDDESTTPPTRPAPTHQSEQDEREKRKHPDSENDLPSTQEKNPVPPGTTAR